MRRPVLRIAILFAWIPLALLVGLAAHSQTAFVLMMGLGLAVSVILRLTLLR